MFYAAPNDIVPVPAVNVVTLSDPSVVVDEVKPAAIDTVYALG
jgi:hypothetical protein